MQEALQSHLGPLGKRRKKDEASAQSVMALLLREKMIKVSQKACGSELC